MYVRVHVCVCASVRHIYIQTGYTEAVESRESVLLMPKKSNEVGRPGVEIGNPLPRLHRGNGGGELE